MAIVSEEIRNQYYEIAGDPIVFVLAMEYKAFIEEEGPEKIKDLDNLDMIRMVNYMYKIRGGKTVPLTIGSIAEAIKILLKLNPIALAINKKQGE
jgi:hypothetical protein